MRNILEWLERSADVYEKKTAFTDVHGSVDFGTLHTQAKVVGSYIASVCETRSPIAFYLEKSTLAMAGMLGAVEAGCFYSLLDLRQPDARLQLILDVLEPGLIVTDSENEASAKEKFGNRKIAVLEDILEAKTIDEECLKNIRAQAQDIDPLYVNFTSGSTGVPKGVVVSHRSVLDFIPHFTEIFGMNENDVFGNQAPFDFDVSVKDIFSGLYTGAEVVIIPREYFSNPTKLMDYLCANECTTLVWAVSAMCFVSIMNGFGYKVPETVNKILFSGEVMPIKQLKIWQNYLPDAMYVNLYGPTEITCNCTYYILDHSFEQDEKMPIGRPFPNERVFLLDEEDRLITEANVTGELCVSGTCLALGYYKNKEKTDQAFVQNPLNTAYNEMIYRTGDLARYSEDGNLVYVSRKDFQIKHLGHRIELGEIETAVEREPSVTRACCLYDQTKKKILLFYTGEVEKKELLKQLRVVLPPFMLPNTMYPLEEMPMTKNGKIDRNVLKEMGGIA